MNAFDFETQEELAGAIKDVANDDNMKVLILTGAGKAFLRGVDVAAIEGLSAQQTRSSLTSAQQLIADLANRINSS